MKLSYTLAAAALIAFSSTQALADRIYAGVNLGSVQGYDNPATTGAVFGSNRQFPFLGDKLVFQLGGQVVQRSFQASGNTSSYFYVEIPAVIKINWGSGLIPRPVAGVNVGFDFYKYCHNSGGSECSAPQSTPMEYAAEFGADEDFTSSGAFPFLQFRYHLPLSTVSPGIKLTGMSLALGYPFK